MAQCQEDIVVQELDVNYPAAAAWFQAAAAVERRRRGATNAVDNLDIGLEDTDWKRMP